MTGKGGRFNEQGRRSGGYRRTVIGVPTNADMERAALIEILRGQVRATGLTGADLEEVYARLDATETSVLRDCVRENAVKKAQAQTADRSEQHPTDPEEKGL